MSSLDDIKKKLKIEDMDRTDRDKIFNKFVEKGGQVIKDKPAGQSIKFNRDKQRAAHQKMAQNSQDIRQKYDKSNKNRSNSGSGDQNDSKKNKRYFSEFLNGFFQGTFNLYGKISKKFTETIEKDFYEIVSSLNFLTGQILLLDEEHKWQMVNFISQKNKFGYELIMRINKLQDDNKLSKIVGFYSKSNSIICDPIIDDLYVFQKELVILYPYWETIKDILWRSSEYYQQLTQTQPYLNKTRINKMVDSLFNSYYPRFHTIINYNTGKRTPYDYRIMYSDYGIQTTEDIGFITKSIMEERKKYLERLEKEKEERLKNLQEEVEKKEIEKMPKYLVKGLELIDTILAKNKGKSDDSIVRLFDPKEKMVHFYKIFTEFDKEYSFIMTTSQIKFITRVEGGVKVDVKYDMDNLYIKYSEISSHLKEYIKLTEEYKDYVNSLGDQPTIQRQKIEKVNIKRHQSLFEVKNRGALFFKAFAAKLEVLIKDYNTEKKLIQNADDSLHFQIELGDKRIFENTPIIKAIIVAFSLSSAFHYYIVHDKLSTNSLYLPVDKDNLTTEENSPQTTDEDKQD